MLQNLTKPENRQALSLTHDLIEIIKMDDSKKLKKWITHIDFDPELIGSAFHQVFNFAEDYLEKMSGE